MIFLNLFFPLNLSWLTFFLYTKCLTFFFFFLNMTKLSQVTFWYFLSIEATHIFKWIFSFQILSFCIFSTYLYFFFFSITHILIDIMKYNNPTFSTIEHSYSYSYFFLSFFLFLGNLDSKFSCQILTSHYLKK